MTQRQVKRWCLLAYFVAWGALGWVAWGLF